MKIYYSDTHPIPQEIVNLIQSHALSHKIIKDVDITDIYLEEGKNKVTGKAAIEDYLDGPCTGS